MAKNYTPRGTQVIQVCFPSSVSITVVGYGGNAQQRITIGYTSHASGINLLVLQFGRGVKPSLQYSFTIPET